MALSQFTKCGVAKVSERQCQWFRDYSWISST